MKQLYCYDIKQRYYYNIKQRYGLPTRHAEQQKLYREAMSVKCATAESSIIQFPCQKCFLVVWPGQPVCVLNGPLLFSRIECQPVGGEMVHFSSVNWPIGSSRGKKDDSAEISREAFMSSSGMESNVHSFIMSIKHFLCQTCVAHLPRWLEGWFWRGCRGSLHARTTWVSSLEQVPLKWTDEHSLYLKRV